jgi:hypothetical protein
MNHAALAALVLLAAPAIPGGSAVEAQGHARTRERIAQQGKSPPSPDAGGLSVRAEHDDVLVLAGGTRLVRVRPVTTRARRGAPQVRGHESAGHALLEVAIPNKETGTGAEVWLGVRRGAEVTTLWQGLVGPLDADGEITRVLSIDASGVRVHQTAAHVTRCDGAPARLFPQRWDFEARRFVPQVPDAATPATPPRLGASAGDPGRPARGGFRFIGASDAEGAAGDARKLTAPSALNDVDAATVWRADSLEGAGRAFLTARSGGAGYGVTGLRLTLPPGVPPPVARLILGPHPEHLFELDFSVAPAARSFWFPLPRPIGTDCVTLDLAMAPGAAALALANVDVFTELDRDDAPAALARDLAGGTDCGARLGLVTNLPAESLARELVAVLPKTRTQGRLCVLRALHGVAGDTAAKLRLDDETRGQIALAAAALVAEASDHEDNRDLATRTLSLAGPAAVPALGRALNDPKASPAARGHLAHLLATLGKPGHDQLLAALASDGPARAGARAALRRRPPPAAALLRAMSSLPPTAATRPELLDLLARARPRDEDVAPARALALASARHERPFVERARAVQVLGALDDPEATAALVGLLQGDADPVIRHLALEAMSPAQSAMAAITMAMADRDPRVREGAARWLMRLSTSAAFAPAAVTPAAVTSRAPWLVSAGGPLLNAFARERWPFVRHAQITALATLCPAGAAAILKAAVAASSHETPDADPEVKRAALPGLVACEVEGALDILAHTLANQDEAVAVRESAAMLLAEYGPARTATGAPLHVQVKGTAERLVVNPDPGVQSLLVAAVAALVALQPRSGVDMALGLTHDARRPVSQGVTQVLVSSCETPEARAALERRAGPRAAPPRDVGGHTSDPFEATHVAGGAQSARKILDLCDGVTRGRRRQN